MKQYLEAGEFVTTHGVTGELKLYPWCDGPAFIAALPRLFFGPSGERETKVLSVRAHKDMCLVRLEGVTTVEQARVYLRKVAYFSRDDVLLPEGRYFVQDIVGCAVEDADTQQRYGVVKAVTHPAACDIYTVENEAGESFLFPAVPEFLVSLAPQAGLVTVRPIPGMFDSTQVNADAD